MKKFFSLFVTLAMLASLVTPTLAYNNTDSEYTYFKYIGNGLYAKADGKSSLSSVESSYETNSDILLARPTADNELMKLGGNMYLFRAAEDSYSLVEEHVIDVENISSNNPLFRSLQIEDRIVNEIQETVAQQHALGNDAFSVFMYTPATEPYMYSGSWFKDVAVKYNDLSVRPFDVKQERAKISASQVASLLVSVAGLASSTLSVVGTAMSVYDVYVSQKAPVQYGTDEDWCYLSIYYDKIVNTTYMKTTGNTWDDGCISQKVYLEHASAHQYYRGAPFSTAAEKELLSQHTLNRIFVTENWDNPAKHAIYNWINTLPDAPVKGTVGNTTVVF